MDINITVENQGASAETFNLTLYADNNVTVLGDEIVIGSRINYLLVNGTTTTIEFAWNTTGVPKSNYTINAFASPLLGEIDTVDNSYVDGWVIVSMAGLIYSYEKPGKANLVADITQQIIMV